MIKRIVTKAELLKLLEGVFDGPRYPHAKITFSGKTAEVKLDEWASRRRDGQATHDAIEAQHTAQGGKCAVCSGPLEIHEAREDWSSVGQKSRGLVHPACPGILSTLRYDPARLRAAADYCERNHKDAGLIRLSGQLNTGTHSTTRKR